ncbi:YceI family protein [Maribacter antarcticus]|uniref:YceI family protein n=1 Tax=Maribacter antarcticus TaxID=505250 RepID=UPI0004792229|nr:YceI family protein [Maribacter antarcticus]
MKYLFFCCLFITISCGLHAQGTRIQEGTVAFSFVEKDVSGTLSDFSSSSVIDWDTLENSVIIGQVASETIRTGNFIRDFSLRRATYFDVDNYPFITFKSTKIETVAEQITVYGTLTLKGISKPIIILFQKDGDTLTGSTTLFTSDFNITILKKGRESNKVTVSFVLKLA